MAATIKRIGSYEIIGEIGHGGMAVVYKGFQASLNRPVAIKVLSQKVSNNKEIVERFNRESLIIARLEHPNIIHVIDRGLTEEGEPYFVMNLVEGTTLSKWMKGPVMPLTKKFDLIIQICKGLSYAHKNGVIHRDIKPANILIDLEENALLTDFGIAQFYNQDTGEEQLTQDGVVLGTISYMSPEQKLGSKNVTAASDIYSMGVIIYEMITGTKPLGHFKRPSEVTPNIPQFIEDTILKCLATEPSDRFRTADEVKDQLLKFLRGGHLTQKKKEKALQGNPALKKRFVLLDVIRESEFGSVHLLQDKTDSQLMVVKKCKLFRDWLFDKKLLTTLRHKNIVRVFGSSGDQENYNIVMEYISGGSLKDRMVQKHPWRKALKTVKGICEGLAYAKKQGVIHGNLRPSNILIDESGEVKVTDFGLEEHYQKKKGKYNWYSPPEEERSTQGDIYSVGVIIYELLLGTLPVWRKNKVVPHEAFYKYEENLQALVLKMIVREREHRYLNFGEVLESMTDLFKVKKVAPPPKVIEKPMKKKKRVSLVLLLLLLLSLSTSLLYFQFSDEMEITRTFLMDKLKSSGLITRMSRGLSNIKLPE